MVAPISISPDPDVGLPGAPSAWGPSLLEWSMRLSSCSRGRLGSARAPVLHHCAGTKHPQAAVGPAADCHPGGLCRNSGQIGEHVADCVSILRGLPVRLATLLRPLALALVIAAPFSAAAQTPQDTAPASATPADRPAGTSPTATPRPPDAPAASIRQPPGSEAVSVAPAGASLPSIGRAHLPSELSPWSMFMSADILVQAVMVGLVFASVVTWTVWLAK